MAKIRIEVPRGGIRQIARSDRVKADLERRARQVAAAARATAPTMHTGTIQVTTESTKGKDRARANVIALHPGVLAAEAKYAFIRRALDAAR
ncbi:hypothetical protein [Streptomyces bohaiensis]|uniref:HK97 gp10 family phage protein n=1 Tax=Streptomyces bohaiensis TaxID=1431344 RepID=A0ABX1CD34_9ACTN|nr:hypothetical protein [Streptomyces bohaiensis]NJQ14224.1 hypothetical protein [Streptomyces bohaiensis]